MRTHDHVAEKTAVETLPGTESGLEHSLLAEGVRRHGAYWTTDDRENEGDNWNTLATENEIHAAISTFNEAKEEKKSRENVAFIMARLAPGTRVLDLGCGYGRLAKYLLPGMRFEAYVGVDCSPVMLKKFHERYADTEAERATPLVLVRGDIDRIPLRDASVDACIVSAVYLHNHKDVTRASLAEIRRVLKPGGRALVVGSLPSASGLTGLQGRLFLAWLKLIGQERKNGPVRYFTRDEVEGMFADFGATEIHPFGFSVLPKTILGMPAALRLPYRRFYDRVHAFLSKRLSKEAQARFCTHYDVVATN
ncbi:MAG TPA: methyltransferase domain-containing protein [Patescibacteria group bacterium]|nr:methyltransferase domain-containing protein [Patescibacteria group bacterium]